MYKIKLNKVANPAAKRLGIISQETEALKEIIIKISESKFVLGGPPIFPKIKINQKAEKIGKYFKFLFKKNKFREPLRK